MGLVLMTDRIENQTTQENGIISCQDTLGSDPCQDTLGSASPERDLVAIFFDYLMEGTRSRHEFESAPYFGTHGANILLNSLPTGTGKTHVTTHGGARFLGFLSTIYTRNQRLSGQAAQGESATLKKIVNGRFVEIPSHEIGAPSAIENILCENRSILFVAKTKNIFTPCHKIYGEISHGISLAKSAVNSHSTENNRIESLGVPVLQLFSANDFKGDIFLHNTSLIGCAENCTKKRWQT